MNVFIIYFILRNVFKIICNYTDIFLVPRTKPNVYLYCIFWQLVLEKKYLIDLNYPFNNNSINFDTSYINNSIH